MDLDKITVKKAITVYPEDTVASALNIMNKNNVNGTPVINKEGNLLGMIVKADIYRFLIDPGHYDSCPVDWVMAKNVITAKEEESILDIARRIRENDIIATPIVNNEKRVIGIISIEDILDYFIDKSEL